MKVDFSTEPVKFTPSGVLYGYGLPGVGRMNQLRIKCFGTSLWTNDELSKEAVYWGMHKLVSAVSIPTNLLAAGGGLGLAIVSATTLGLWNITTFALTLGNNQRVSVDTKVVTLLTGAAVSGWMVVQNVIEVALSSLWLVSRFVSGVDKAVQKEVRAIDDIRWLKWIEEPTAKSRINWDSERSVKEVFRHYSWGSLNVPVQLVHAAGCLAISAMATALLLGRAALYATTGVEFQCESYAKRFGVLAAISAGSAVQDVAEAVADVFILLYKLGKVLRLDHLVQKVYELALYIPDALFEDPSKAFERTAENQGFGFIGSLNRKRASYSEISLQNKDNLSEELGAWIAHKGLTIVAIPANLVAVGAGIVGALGSACTVGVMKIAYFALRGFNREKTWNVETRCLQMTMGVVASSLHLVSNAIELLKSPLFISNRLQHGWEKAVSRELPFPSEESPLVRWIEEPTDGTRIRFGKERSAVTAITHYLHSIVNISVHAVNIVISGIAAVAESAFFALKVAFYAATKIDIPLPSYAHWAIGSAVQSLDSIIRDVVTAVADVFVLLYHSAAFINEIFRIGLIARGVWSLITYIPQAIGGTSLQGQPG